MWAGLEGLCGCQVGRSRSFLRFTDLALVATVEICLDSWLIGFVLFRILSSAEVRFAFYYAHSLKPWLCLRVQLDIVV